MDERGRRTFLKGSLAAAGVIVGGRARDAGAAGGSTSQAFLAAVEAGDVEGVRRAIAEDRGLVHVRDATGRSAFALALVHRHREVADLVREGGHSPDVHELALARDWEAFMPLAEESPGAVNRDHPLGGTAMYAAALGGAGTQIWRVYSFGGDPNLFPRGEDGHTPVRAALDHPDLGVAELTAASLLGNGASPNGPERDGSTALHAAARRGSTELVELLVRKGAYLAARDAHGRTALDLAHEERRRDTAELLRRHESIPRDHSTSREAYDVDGHPYTRPDLGAFSVTVTGRVVGQSHTDLDAVRAAVDRHPELAHSRATTTEWAVEAGAHMGRTDIVDFLLGHGAPCSLPTAVMRNDVARARELLREDPLRIHERGPHDFALLWYPVIGKGLLEMAGLLLDSGAEIERQHWLGTTALHYAALGGQLEMVSLLLDRGADPDRVGRKFGAEGATPLQVAQARGHDAVVKLLRARGARG